MKSANPSTAAENSTSAGKSAAPIPGLKARYSKGGILSFPSASVKRDKERFSFKDCKAWNIYNAECLDVHILGNIDPGYTGCPVLDIPDDPHSWNAMRSVIDQFYQREKDIAWERYGAREAIKKASKLEKKLAQAEEIADISLRRLQELERKNSIKESLLNDLLQQRSAKEWIDGLSTVLDELIRLAEYDQTNNDALFSARQLQQFFMNLEGSQAIDG